MQTVLGLLVILGILLQIQVRYASSSSNGYYLEVPPPGVWTFVNTVDKNNNPGEEFIRDHRSVPRFHDSYNVPNLQPTLRQFPQTYGNYDRYAVAPHLSVRRSVSTLSKQKELKPPKPAQTSQVSEIPVTTDENSQFLLNYNMDLDKVAYNSAKYVRLSVIIILEHAKCLYDIVKISLRHMGRKLKLLLRNPLQLIFLPFTLPIDAVKFIVETMKFGLTFIKYLFARP